MYKYGIHPASLEVIEWLDNASLIFWSIVRRSHGESGLIHRTFHDFMGKSWENRGLTHRCLSWKKNIESLW